MPARILAPILLALACAGALMAFFWWQLATSTVALTRESDRADAIIREPAVGNDGPVDPRDRSLLHLRQGDVLAARGEWAQAQEEYGESVRAGGGLPALRKLAQIQLQRRDMPGVRSTIRKLKSDGAKPEDIVLLESIIELRSGELVKARALLDESEDTPQKHYGTALLGIVQGNHDLAQTELAAAIGGWEPALRARGRILQAAYSEFALFPESSNLHLITLLARALAQVQECELAIPLLVQVTQQKSDYRDAWTVQVYCELTTERPEQALASLEQAYALDPQKPEIQFFLARAHAALGEHRNAITFFEYALTNGFTPPSEVRRLIAGEAVESGDADLALLQYEELIRAPDATIEFYEQYAGMLMTLGRKEAALAKSQAAASLWPEDARAHEILAIAALALGAKDAARGALDRALAINPYSLRAKELMKKLE